MSDTIKSDNEPEAPIPEAIATKEQATLLQCLRPRLRPVARTLQGISECLAFACEHGKNDTHQPDTCPICYLYGQITDLDLGWGKFGIDLDVILDRAEVPDDEDEDTE